MSRLEPYIYTPLPAGHMRLLHVFSTQTRSNLLRCKLQVFSLENGPAFEALSYAWGTEKASERIVCNGATLPVTPHLLRGLRSISEALSVQWLWIDAICINQSEDIEKATQVMQMWQMYSAASRVVVWMGPSDITANLISTVRAVSEDSDQVPMDEPSRDEMERFLSPVAARNDLAKLFTSTWFVRLWVMQEVVLAHSAIALYGTQVVELWSVLELGAKISWAGLTVPNLPDRLPFWACMSFIAAKAYAKHNLKSEGVARLLHSVREKQTSERLDRVYAILGLLDGKIRDQVIIDYSQNSRKEYWKTYIRFCKLILQKYGESYLPHLSYTDRSTTMPSWCLNLDVGEGSERFYSPCCGVGIDATHKRCRGVIFSGNGLAISPEVFQVDMVEKMALSYPVSRSTSLHDDRALEKHLSFLSSCNDLLVEMASCGENNPLKSLAMVLVGGTNSERPINPHYEALEAEKDLHNCLEIWKDAQLDFSQKSNLLSCGRNLSYMRSLGRACSGRSIFHTMGGKFVLSPKDAQKGDIIVVIKGFKFPYILRPVPCQGGQDSKTYNILGTCYVDDIADGAALQSEQFKVTGWTDVKII